MPGTSTPAHGAAEREGPARRPERTPFAQVFLAPFVGFSFGFAQQRRSALGKCLV